MQKKVGTLLDEELLKKAKARAHAEHTTLNHVFERALLEYLSRQSSSKQKLSTVETSFGVMRLPRKVVRRIAQEEIYEIEQAE